MKILHLSTHDFRGGAAIAAYRQHEALRRAGMESKMWVFYKDSSDGDVHRFIPPKAWKHRLPRLIRRRKFERIRRLAPRWQPFLIDQSEHAGADCSNLPTHDVINLHHGAGFVDVPVLFRNLSPKTPIVYTLHDMHPMTGGCHHADDCEGFTKQCGSCPRLSSDRMDDLSHRIWQRKKEAYGGRPSGLLHFVADSHWLAGRAGQSSLMREMPVSVIHYGLDLEVFRPIEARVAREALGIPMEAKVLGFAAAQIENERKGIRHLVEALQGMGERPFLLSWGQGYPEALHEFPHVHLGSVHNERLIALAYGAADVCVVPSLEEAFGQTALESLACGRPVVSFAAGGLTDTVRHEETGLLAETGNVSALREGISRLLSDAVLRRVCGQNGRRMAEEEYSYDRNATQYIQLYRTLLNNVK